MSGSKVTTDTHTDNESVRPELSGDQLSHDATVAPPTVPASLARGGAPQGNTNAIRHGMTTGSDPEPYVTRLTRQFRQQVEQAVLTACGSITVAAASEIQAAAEWENHRIKAKRWLREAGEKLSPEQRLAFSREAAKAASERTKHLKALCIGSPTKRSLWATLEPLSHEVEPKSTQEPAA